MSIPGPSDEQIAGQHYLVCGIEDCQRNGQFYCNECHKPMCEHCRDEHLKRPDTKIHEIVLYRYRKRQLPVEKCKLHPTRNIDIFCKECKIPLCSKCSTMKEHDCHKFEDLEEIYTGKVAIWEREFSKIQKYFLPTSQGLKTDIEEDVTKIKKLMESIRTSMKTESESLKNLVDEVTSENLEHTYAMENSLLEMLKSEETKYDDYIAYLEKMTDAFQDNLSMTNKKLLLSEPLKIQSIPETTKPVPPVFTAGQFNKNDVSKFLGVINVPYKEPEKRIIASYESVSAPLKFTEKKQQQRQEKTDMKRFLSYSVTKVREYSVPNVDNAYHVSVNKSGRLWVSDKYGTLVQLDFQGKLLQKIQISREAEGYHTITENKDLLYADIQKEKIYRITHDNRFTEFIKTINWTPLSIQSSHINGDILVGMTNCEEAKVTRYNTVGEELQNIQRDNQGEELYSDPHYIAENINGDICTSDLNKHAVVVVNKSGQHRFSYTGKGSEFYPWGICTDLFCNILVCDSVSESIHLLDQNGGFQSFVQVHSQKSGFLSSIFSLNQHEHIKHPRGVCVDDENNLYVGQFDTNRVKVYRYIQGH